MNKVLVLLAALVVSLAATAAQASTVYFDSGSAKMRGGEVAAHKKKVWVPAHRAKGHWVKGHYIWR